MTSRSAFLGGLVIALLLGCSEEPGGAPSVPAPAAAPPVLPAGWEIVARETGVDVAARPEVAHPASVPFRVEADGRPVLSAAGFVQAVADGPQLYDAYHLKRMARWAAKNGRRDKTNWGEPEVFAAVQRIADAWTTAHPDGPRLGLLDISGRDGGFPDLNADGLSDHATHQIGTNVGILFPCLTRPELVIWTHGKSAKHLDVGLTRELVDLVFAGGGMSITTNAATRLLDDVSGVPALRTGLRQDADPSLASRGMQRYVGTDAHLILKLMVRQGDHGEHLNVDFSFLR